MKRKRKNIILWCFVAIALILGTALLCFLLWRYVFPLGAESPESQLNRYYSCIMTGDYAEMYEMLTMDSRSAISEEAFIKRNQNIYEGIEAKNIKVQVTGEEGKGREHSLTFQKKSPASSAQSAKRWEINWFQ